MTDTKIPSFIGRLFFNNRATIFSLFLFVILLIIGFFSFNFLKTPPQDFPLNKEIVVEKGTSLREAIKKMKEEGVLRSEWFAYGYMIFNHENESVKAGTYKFVKPLNLPDLLNELILGNHRNELIRFTHIEGESVNAIAQTAAVNLEDFATEKFIELARPSEGKLFPETYLIPVDYTAEELFSLLNNTFLERMSGLQVEIDKSNLTLDEIIILASIIEREANTVESKKMVSGILQNRLAIGMPLQVDASIEYVLNKSLSELTPEDLEINSPYNTYLHKGLPPTAIGNPGMEAIMAVLEPTKSDYLFYITGDDGRFYYAKNFEEHRLNIVRHLH